MKYPNNIEILRKKTGFTVERLATAAGISRGYLNELKRGDKFPGRDVLKSLAKVLNCKTTDLIDEGETLFDKIPIIGDVGAGGSVCPIDDLPLMPTGTVRESEREFINCDFIDAPPNVSVHDTVALRVRHTSMMPFMAPGTIVFYKRRIENGADDSCIGKLCVVMTRQGDALLKIVKRSALRQGAYDLISYNMDTIEGVELLWCAKVISITPA